MAKPALGRGLGNLLGDTQIADKPEPAEANPDTAATAVSPGLGNLLTAGRNGGTEKPAPANSLRSSPNASSQGTQTPSLLKSPNSPTLEPPEEGPVQAPRWVLIGADLLLVALAALLVFKSPAPLKPWEMTLCLAAVMVGAVLACVAALNPPRR